MTCFRWLEPVCALNSPAVKSPFTRLSSRLTGVVLTILTAAASPAADSAFPPQPPVPYLSVEGQLKQFELPPGYRLEPVLTEPRVIEPVVAAFDGNGRMFVAEMRTYMQDIDGSNSHQPVSRVSLHWSSKGDGNYDRESTFIDKLILPRMILPLDKGALLVNETDTLDIHLYRDTDGDGVADEKKLWYEGGKRGGNLEHQQSGLIWATDNWLYMTYNAWRLRWNGWDKPPLKESTAPNGGQWGLTQDDWGKPWYVNAGGEKGPVNFQSHIVYGAFNVEDQFVNKYAEVWPVVPIPDVQGGEKRFRPDAKTLNHFTATCGAEVFRGDRLPADLRGDLLFSEPVGRLVRRTKIEVRDGLSYLSNPYESKQGEFIRSTDPNFRVVNLNTAPDGTLYLVDMYRGIIQEGNWVKEGSYLRKVVQQYQLDKNFGRGRIWRLVHQDFQPGPQPRMFEESPAQLVAHLAHPNGWWRDTAQKLLILRSDRSVVSALQQLARTHSNPLARSHALWTLEGLGALDASLVREKLKDSEPQVRATAIRTGETLYKAGDKSLEKDVFAAMKDGNVNVAIQATLTANLLKLPNVKPLTTALAVNTNAPAGLREISTQLVAPKQSFGKEWSAAEKKKLEHGQAIYAELCFACHGPDGKGTPVEGQPGITLAPPLSGSRTVIGHHDSILLVMLKGLTGPVNGKTYEAQMVPMESNDDEWIAAISSYVRNSFGNNAGVIDTKAVTRLRAKTKDRVDPWTTDELAALLPQPLANRKAWKLTASHNPAGLGNALDGRPDSRWETKESQAPGMWLQIELPTETEIAGLILDAGNSARDYPRGYEVVLSGDGENWGKPAATGKGSDAFTEITFPAAKAKFVRITQTGAVKGLYWSIHELEVLQPAKGGVAMQQAAKPKGPSFE